ncbi:MAG: aminotransferase class V-fold PLP-dependent enzyme [Acidobacteriota bacterium]
MSADARFSRFLDRFPDYAATGHLDELRRRDYARLDHAGQIYLDYTGAALYGESQVRQHLALLEQGVFGNPHSANPASLSMTGHVESTRRAVLDFFGAGDDYLLVFTPNATGALKLVGESFPFSPASRFLATSDNHNSVNGIREFARRAGAGITYCPLTESELRLDPLWLSAELDRRPAAAESLFALPAQSNYSGVKHDLTWVTTARRRGWRVLLDAAAFVPTNRLDLQRVAPDFLSISFYKMFGYPAGVGALLVRKETLSLLDRPWFAGGTVNFTTVKRLSHVLSTGEAAFEDGTVNYLSIPAVRIGLEHLAAIGMETIGTRVRCLSGWLLEELHQLKHANGKPFVKLHGPATTEARGGTITFNLYDPFGARIDYRRIEELAGLTGISLRTGCFCNPGANEAAEGLTDEDIALGQTLGNDWNLPNFVRLLEANRLGRGSGAIRASIGLASNFTDVARLVDFLRPLRDQPRAAIGQVSVSDDTCRVIRDSA